MCAYKNISGVGVGGWGGQDDLQTIATCQIIWPSSNSETGSMCMQFSKPYRNRRKDKGQHLPSMASTHKVSLLVSVQVKCTVCIITERPFSPIVNGCTGISAALDVEGEKTKSQEPHAHAKADTVHSLVANKHVASKVGVWARSGRIIYTESGDLPMLNRTAVICRDWSNL